MISGKKNLLFGCVWAASALALLLFPSPRGWGPYGWKINHYYDEYRLLLQPTVHFVLMAACTLLIMRFFARRPAMKAAFYAVAIAVCLAIILEFMQSLLPIQFARACDPQDLVPSVAGAVGGMVVGVWMRLRKINRDNGE